ncbi:MAG: hypothetical protein AAF089_13705 [Bacteroidota bacterium]
MSAALDARIAAIAAAAKAWQDPEFMPRAKAAHATLSAPNRFTEEAVAFAVNQQKHHLASPKKLRGWFGDGDGSSERVRIGIAPEGATPLDGLRALAAVWLAGHDPVVRVPASSPHLLPAFAESVASEGDLSTAFAADDAQVLSQTDALLVAGPHDAVDAWREQAVGAGIPAERLHLSTRRTTVAVIDGTEDFDARIGLAEDILLHEGLGEANVALLWAPKGIDADPYFEAFSGFRQIMPAHADTDGVLEMPRAFLKAAKQPYAWGDGVLVSRGDPDVQTAGHLRWAEYDSLDAVTAWIDAHQNALGGVVATEAVARRVQIPPALHIKPGDAHRSRLGTAADRALMAFVRSL